MDRSDTGQCACGGAAVRIVRGNDFTVEARLYFDDAGGHAPLDLSTAREAALGLVGPFSRVAGRGVSAKGNTVSAFFPAESMSAGLYGVEVTFRDSKGKARLYERDMVTVVESGSDTTVKSASERIISVDVKTRTIRLGGTDYGTLDGKPSIGGVELVGDRTPAELGLVGSRAVTAVTVLTAEDYAALAEKEPSTLYIIIDGGPEDEA